MPEFIHEWWTALTTELGKQGRQNDAEILRRIAQLESTQESILERLDKGAEKMRESHEIAIKVQEGTALIVEWIDASKGAFKMLVALGTVAKWFGAIAAAAVAIMALWHDWTGK